MSESNEWLKNLRAGDTVIVELSGAYRSQSVKKVDRVIPTQIIIGSTKYNKSYGREIGGGSNRWNHYYLSEATPAKVQQVRDDNRRNNLAFKLRDMQWAQLPLATLEAIDALLVAQAATDAPEVVETEKT